MNKIVPMKEAVDRYVKDGDFLFIGGYICRTPFAAIHEIIRQGRKDLTITRSNAAEDFDMMIGAGVVKRFISTFLSLGIYGLGRCYRRSIEKGIPHKIEIEEYTNLSFHDADGRLHGNALCPRKGYGRFGSAECKNPLWGRISIK